MVNMKKPGVIVDPGQIKRWRDEMAAKKKEPNPATP